MQEHPDSGSNYDTFEATEIPYTVNNFHSSWNSTVYPDAKTILHVGEIDPAIHSLTRDSVRSVTAVDINPGAVAAGLWKKEAIRRLSPQDFDALMHLNFGVRPFSYARAEQLKPDAYGINLQIMANLPPWSRDQLRRLFEYRTDEPWEKVRVDNGAIENLHYLDPILYETARNRLERLNIELVDGFSMLPFQADMISMNNIFDYTEGDVTGKFRALAQSLNQNGRLVIASRNAAKGEEGYVNAYDIIQVATGRIEAFEKDGAIRLPVKTRSRGGLFNGGHAVVPEGGKRLLSDVLTNLGLELAGDSIVSNYVTREAAAFGKAVSAVENNFRDRPLIYYTAVSAPFPKDSLEKFGSATTREQLERIYKNEAAEAFKYSAKTSPETSKYLLSGILKNLRDHPDLTESDLEPFQLGAEIAWRNYWTDVQREAEPLGIDPFQKSGALTLYSITPTPGELIFKPRGDFWQNFAVEVYKKV